MQPNTLYFGDNLQVLRDHFPSESVDLVYRDPPFNSARNYNMVFSGAAGEDDTAQIQAFADTWSFEGAAEAFYEITATPAPVGKLLEGLRQAFGDTSLLGYLSVMALRLRELHRGLKPTGSLYLHCDPTASHYLKMVLDCIFGGENLRNEVTWKRTHAHGDSRRRFAWISDTILFYAASKATPFSTVYLPYSQEYIDKYYRHRDANGRRYQLVSLRSPNPRPNLVYDYKGYKPHRNGWAVSREKMAELDAQGRLYFPPNPDGAIRELYFLDEMPGVVAGDIWTDIDPISAHAAERLGYPTQKPLALLERIILASSNPGDLILDPFCGCGTAVAAAQKLGRQWCGIDITTLAVSLIKKRLLEHFPEAFPSPDDIPVKGFPVDVAGARALAESDRHAFEHWSLTLLGAAPAVAKKKGADHGIDGEFAWRDAADQQQRGLVSVKSGHVNVTHIRDLRGTMEREGAAMGLLVTLAEPTGPMRTEVAGAGRYQVEGLEKSFPRLQIVTVAELLAGHEPDLPRWRLNPFKGAKAIEDTSAQGTLFGEDEG